MSLRFSLGLCLAALALTPLPAPAQTGEGTPAVSGRPECLPPTEEDVSFVRRLYDEQAFRRTCTNNNIAVEGEVTQYVEDEATDTRFYFLNDNYGVAILVRTPPGQPQPEISERYRITGVVDYEDAGRQEFRRGEIPASVRQAFSDNNEIPFISEYGRTPLGGVSTVPDSGVVEPLDEAETAWWMYALVAAGVLALLGLGTVLVRSMGGSGAHDETRKFLDSQPQDPQATPSDSYLVQSEPEVVSDASGTIKIHRPTRDQTVKVLPGRFAVLGGLDGLPEIRFFMPHGRTTTEITFGRASGKPYEHVQLAPRTVSSRQATLVYNGGQYSIRNHASRDSNPTAVNGRDLGEGETVMLNDGDRISMGEVEFQYHSS